MIKIDRKIFKSAGNKASAEDAASLMLYKFDRSVLDGRAVPMERLARCLGLDVACEYVSGDCTDTLGIVAFEPQRLYIKNGNIDLDTPTAIVERDIIDRGESGLYSLTLAFMCAEMIFNGSQKTSALQGQISFGLDTVQSSKHKVITLGEQFDGELMGKEAPSGFAFKLLLPKNGFKRQVAELYAEYGVNRSSVTSEVLDKITAVLAARYVVPQLAVAVRLKQLNLC